MFAATGTGAMEGAVANTLSRRRHGPGGGRRQVRRTLDRAVQGLRGQGGAPDQGGVGPCGGSPGSGQAAGRQPGHQGGLRPGQRNLHRRAHPVQELAAGDQEAGPAPSWWWTPSPPWGAIPCPWTSGGIDMLVAGSQKAMMLPPGMAFAALSPKAWEFVKTAKCPKYYFDFAKQLKSQQKNQTPYTSAGDPDMGLQEVMGWIRGRGPGEDLRPQPAALPATKAAMKAMGMELYSKENPSDVLTAVWPAGATARRWWRKCGRRASGSPAARPRPRARSSASPTWALLTQWICWAPSGPGDRAQ